MKESDKSLKCWIIVGFQGFISAANTWKVATCLHLTDKIYSYLFYNDATILTVNALYLHHLSRKTEGIGPMMSWQVNTIVNSANTYFGDSFRILISEWMPLQGFKHKSATFSDKYWWKREILADYPIQLVLHVIIKLQLKIENYEYIRHIKPKNPHPWWRKGYHDPTL